MSNYCNLCGRRLRTIHYKYQHPAYPDRSLTVCPRCRRLAPRCRQCHQPMRLERSTAGLCAACAAGAPRCLSCGTLIGERYYEINGHGPYCETCHATRQHCDVCGAPLDARAQRLPDGRAICGFCQPTAVLDADRANELWKWVGGVIESVLNLRLRVGARFVLTDQAGVLRQLKKMKPQQTHESDHVLGVYVRDGRQRTIYAQNGLPQILFIQVVAHEWAHAWQAENCPLVRDILIVEGFAEWVAYKVLQGMQASKKMALMTARTDLYGEGLRLILTHEAREGTASVPRICSRATHEA